MKASESGEGSYADLARLFDVNPRTLERWVAPQRATASVAPLPKRGGWRCPIDVSVPHALIREAADATVAELCWEYNHRVARPHRTTSTSVRRAMRRAGYVLKNNGRGRATSIGRTSKPSARRS